MDSNKQGGSETSSDENDRLEKSTGKNSGTIRSYLCTYCKRGFTNAQALGGHMNIHRKDKARAKKDGGSSSRSHKATVEEEYIPVPNPSFPCHPSHFGTGSEVSGPRGGENLRLRIGTTSVGQDCEERGSEVDLELRLGHNP